MQLTACRRALSALLLAAAGCGGGLGGGSDPNSYDGFVEQFRAAVCAQSVSCGVAPSVASCQASYQEDLLTVSTRDAVRAGMARYDAAKGSSCLRYMDRAYAATPCSSSAFAAVDPTGADDCDAVLAGTIADGGACMLSAECVSGNCQTTDSFCYPGQQCCPGTCMPKPAPTPLGGDCLVPSPGPNCVKGTECFLTSGTCQVPSAVVGAPCDFPAECAEPLFCVIDPTGSTGTCQPRIASGAPCNRDVYDPCVEMREYCHPDTAICAPRVAVGAPCNTNNLCIIYAECMGGRCVALPGADGACDTSIGLTCLGTLQCSAQTRTCKFPPAAISCVAGI